jgi:hypothetical protein
MVLLRPSATCLAREAASIELCHAVNGHAMDCFDMGRLLIGAANAKRARMPV